MQKHNLKINEERLDNFRLTMDEIVGVKNGIIPEDHDASDFVKIT